MTETRQVLATKIRIGVVGCGFIARQHCQRFVEDNRVELALFSDPVEATARQLRDDFAPLARVESSATAAIDDPALDAVALCSPTLAHYEQTCQALDRGLHVLCEKPLAAERWQILDTIARRDRAARVLAVSYQRRYKPPYLFAQRELSQRADWYGPLQQVHVFVCERWEQTITGTWRDDPGVGAGYFGDAGSHQIDIVNFISGSVPTAVWAVSDRRRSRVEIVTQAAARLKNGAALQAHFVGDANHWREDLHFHCRHADLLLRSEQVFRCRDNRIEQIAELPAGSSPAQAFVDAMVEGIPVAAPPECALPMFDWTAGVLRSASEGQWVELPRL